MQCLGAPLEGLDQRDLLVDYEPSKLSTPDNTVDILTSIGGMSFDDIWNNRVDVEVEGVPIHFISNADLIENKKQVGRHLDLTDAEELERRTSSPPVDPPDPPAAGEVHMVRLYTKRLSLFSLLQHYAAVAAVP